MFNCRMLPLSLILLLGGIQAAYALTFDSGVQFYGEVGQGPITFTQPITCSAMDSNGVTVIFTDFNMGSDYGTIGFASSVGCSVSVSAVSTNEIDLTATVTAAIATVNVYTPGKGTPTVSGTLNWSINAETVNLILTNGVKQVKLLYGSTMTPGTPTKKPPLSLSEISSYVSDNIVILLPLVAIILYILNMPVGRRRRAMKQIRRGLRWI